MTTETPGVGWVGFSIIIPAFDESKRLPGTLRSVAAFAKAQSSIVELIIVDDGSTDETAGVAAACAAENLRVRVLRNEINRGKGFSVRRGMLEASGEVLLMCDADLSTPLNEIHKLQRFLNEGFDVAIGSREMPDSRLDPPQPKYRRWMGGIFAVMRSLILVRGFVDSQCGFKLFTRRAARMIFEKLKTDGYAFDCEVLARAVRLQLRVREVGVNWRNDPDSRIRPVRDSIRMLASLLTIRRQLRRESRQTGDPGNTS